MMKIITGILCLFCGVQLMAQPSLGEANEIVLRSDLDYEEAFEFIREDWLKKGYLLTSSDLETGLVETMPFIVRWGFIDADIMDVSFRCQLHSAGRGTQIIFSGQVDIDPGRTRFLSMPVSNNGQKKSAADTSWLLMKEMAGRVPSQHISYRQNPSL